MMSWLRLLIPRKRQMDANVKWNLVSVRKLDRFLLDFHHGILDMLHLVGFTERFKIAQSLFGDIILAGIANALDCDATSKIPPPITATVFVPPCCCLKQSTIGRIIAQLFIYTIGY